MSKEISFKKTVIIFFILLSSVSCNSIIILENRIKYVKELVNDSNFIQKNIKTNRFLVFSYQKFANLSNKTINIYIEGDGLAWKSRYELSHNPTPTNPISLKMSLVDNADNVLYLARPCQYIDFNMDKNCQNREFWSRARFSSKVIESYMEIIDKMKNRYGFSNIRLFGFSGGAAIATLVAAHRSDVTFIGTVAGNLDHEELTRYHKVTPLNKSLNPADFIGKIHKINQMHFAASQDDTVPPQVIESFSKRINNQNSGLQKSKTTLINRANHEYQRWPEVWEEFVNKKDNFLR